MGRLAVIISRSQGLVTVTMDGELDRANAPEVVAALRAARRLATHTVVLDAQGITFIDAAGRRALDAPTHNPARPQLILLASPAIRRFDQRVGCYRPAA
jgi:anti-anti-sigma factor